MAEIKTWVLEHGRIVLWGIGGLVIAVVAFMLFKPSPANNQSALAMSSSVSSSPDSSATGSSQFSALKSSVASSTGGQSTPATTSSSSTDQKAFADVQGAVLRPGLYPVEPTTRVADLLLQAGGLTTKADRQQINLAQKVTDQQVIFVPEKGQAGHSQSISSASGASNAASSSGVGGSAGTPTGAQGQINLNQADVSQLQQLSGIGAKKAQKIIDYRNSHGPFKSVSDLQNVAGFGEKTIAKYRDQLTV